MPVRVEKCRKCHSHEHSANDCKSPLLCIRCGQQHPLRNSCTNDLKCANCGESHFAGHSACAFVQSKRREIAERNAQARAHMLVRASNTERVQFQFREEDFPVDKHTDSATPRMSPLPTQNRAYAEAVRSRTKPTESRRVDASTEQRLTSSLANLDQRLLEMENRLATQLCEVETKIDAFKDKAEEGEKAVYELALPFIQRLTSIFLRFFKPAEQRKELAQFDADLKAILANRPTVPRKPTEHEPPTSTPTSTRDGQ